MSDFLNRYANIYLKNERRVCVCEKIEKIEVNFWLLEKRHILP